MMLDDNKNHFGGRITKKEPVTKQAMYLEVTRTVLDLENRYR